MPKFRRGVLRFAAVAAFVALLQPLLPTISLADATKDFPLCIQACNDALQYCKDNCVIDCTALFPTNNSARNACKNACYATCDTALDTCKARCHAIKDGECPPEP